MTSIPLLDLWSQRKALFTYACMNIKIRFGGTKLGLIWTVIEPLLLFTFLYVIFTNIRIATKEDFAIYLLIGIIMYHAFVRGTQGGLGALNDNSNIIKSLNIKKEFFPVVSTITTAILFLLEVATLLVLMPIFNFEISWTIVLLPIIFTMLFILILGASYILSILLVFVKDIQPLWGVLLTVIFFVTPIFWYLEDSSELVNNIHSVNPLGQLVDLAHKVTFGELPDITEWAYSFIFVIVILFISYMVFQKFESKVAERL